MTKRWIIAALFWLAALTIIPAAHANLLDSQDQAMLESRAASLGICGVDIDLNVRIPVPPTPDQPAVDLFATVIRHGDRELPTILVATPYRREVMMMLYLTLLSHDYHLMAVDIRGTGSSEGQWISFGPEEHLDIAHVVDNWIPVQPWSDGRVGMIGPSYMAIIQLMAAGQIKTDGAGDPVHLKALFPLVSMSDAYRDIVMHGGNIDLEFIPMWLFMVDILGALPPLLYLGEETPFTPNPAELEEAAAIWNEHLRNIPVHLGWIMDPEKSAKTDFYEVRSPMIYWPQKPDGGWYFPNYQYLNEPGAIGTIPRDLPVFLTGGWFDIFTRGTLNNYQYGLAEHRVEDKALVVGPWYHIDGSMGLGLSGIFSGEIPARWFDWKIKGVADPFMVDYPVLLYVDGAKKWRAEKDWPLPESRLVEKQYFLSKRKAKRIRGDWFSFWNADRNYQLVESAGVLDYNHRFAFFHWPKKDPVLDHDPMALHGWYSRSGVRWFMGMTALYGQASKLLFNTDIDDKMTYDDERRDEVGVLTFTTEPLEEDLEISGPMTFTFWARTDFTKELGQAHIDRMVERIYRLFNIEGNLIMDALTRRDVQWVAEINDVFPDGRARNISSGWLSAWHRPYDPEEESGIDPAYLADPFNPLYCRANKNPDPIEEDKTYAYVVEIWPMENVFKAGHRIRVSLSASDFPHLMPVLRPSRNTIVIDEEHPARIAFTAVKPSGEGVEWKWIEDPNEYLIHDTD